ncbi:hypothetical protein [Pseudomonas profundi]|uniref:hypothetical protein n=1 Tax=Pseudomonas profundi TaxID=1981513 RepID=UPI001239CE57|nr:hypothetical protein [Pseudomonas profundi]
MITFRNFESRRIAVCNSERYAGRVKALLQECDSEVKAEALEFHGGHVEPQSSEDMLRSISPGYHVMKQQLDSSNFLISEANVMGRDEPRDLAR